MMPMARNDSPGPRPRARREGLVCPSPSLEDLRKALDQKAMTVTDIRNYYEDVMERFNDDDMDMETKERLIHTHYVSIDVLKDLFSVFQKDYDLQVHVSRKQLEYIYTSVLAKPHSARLVLKELLEAQK